MDNQRVVRLFNEPNAVVPDTQSKLFGLALQLLDISGTSLCKPMKSLQNTHRLCAINATHIGLGSRRKFYQFHAPSAFEVGGGHP